MSNPNSKIYKSIKILLENHPTMLEQLFFTVSGNLKGTPEDLRKETSYYSSGETKLREMTFEIWNGSGTVNLHNFVGGVDRNIQQSFLNALDFLINGNVKTHRGTNC